MTEPITDDELKPLPREDWGVDYGGPGHVVIRAHSLRGFLHGTRVPLLDVPQFLGIR